MSDAVRKNLKNASWKDLYQIAIYESDLNKLPERINDADTAILMRARELFYAADNDGEECESLDAAMCILHALRSSLRRRPTTVPVPTRIHQLMHAAG
jgi:hypothetical protein